MAKDKAPFGKSLPFWSLDGSQSHGNTMSMAAYWLTSLSQVVGYYGADLNRHLCIKKLYILKMAKGKTPFEYWEITAFLVPRWHYKL
jgi:hypothetical protein